MIFWRYKVQVSILISLPKTFWPSTVNVRSKFWRNWKTKRTFKSLIFWLILWDENCIFKFWYPCRKLFHQAQWMFVQSSEEFEKNRTSKKIFFTESVPLDTQNAVLRKWSKFFSHGSKKVSLQVMSLLIPTSRRELI